MTLHENSWQINLITCSTRPCEPMTPVHSDTIVPGPLLLLALLVAFSLTALFGSQKHC